LGVDSRNRLYNFQPDSAETDASNSGLYGLLKLHEITGDADALRISLAWFRDRFEVGTTKASQTAPTTQAARINLAIPEH